MSKIAYFSAFWLAIGVAAFSGTTIAADLPGNKPAITQPAARSGTHDMAAHGMATQGEEQNTGGGCCGQMGGMMCDHKGGMMCDHKGGMMGSHKGGMMGGHGAGMKEGSKRLHMIMSLDLNDDQRSKINKLSDELQHNNWATKGLIMDESAKLRDLYAADKRDPSAISKEYRKIFELQLKMIEATLAAQNRIEEILTPEQRTKLKSMRQRGAPMHDHPMH